MFKAVQKRLPELKQSGAIIVDVRSPLEFSSGHAEGSINIPLPELEVRAKNLDRSKTILLCCASGARSGMAASILKRAGFKDVINAGPWGNLR